MSEIIFRSLTGGQIGAHLKQSNREAAHWYRLAATQNFPEAQQKLADLYYTGQGVPLSYTQAAAWYRKAAEQGLAAAQANLGAMYANGESVPQDYAQAITWWRKASN